MKLIISLGKYAFLFFIGLITIVFIVDLIVVQAAKSKVYSSTVEIPKNKVGLLLGTGKHLNSGRLNLYYKYRIAAAAELYKAGKIEHILVSGDNGQKDYDEPTKIKDDLIANGVPESKIHLDYAGFRTLDSVVRCKEIFGQSKITVISQQFHNERAIFIAKRKGIEAVAYNAKDISLRAGYKVVAREKLARVKMMLDWLFGKKPKFLGEKIGIK